MDPVVVGIFALALLLAVWVRRVLRRLTRRARRGPNAHHNADGSPKREYRTERAARAAAVDYQRDFGDAMAAYRCARGRHWHIGHRRSE